MAQSVLAITIGALAADLNAETENNLALASAAPAIPMMFFFGAEREASSVNYYADISPAVAGTNDATGSYESMLDENVYVEQPLDALPSDVAQSVEVALAVAEVDAVVESSVSQEGLAEVTTNPEIEEFSQAELFTGGVNEVDAAAETLTVAAATDDVLVDESMIDEIVEETVNVETFSEETLTEEIDVAMADQSGDVGQQSNDLTTDVVESVVDTATTTTAAVAKKPGLVRRFMSGIFSGSRDNDAADVETVVVQETVAEESVVDEIVGGISEDVVVEGTVADASVELDTVTSNQDMLADSAGIDVETDVEITVEALTVAATTDGMLADESMVDEVADETVGEKSISAETISAETFSEETVAEVIDDALADENEKESIDAGQPSDDLATGVAGSVADAAVTTAEVVAEKPGGVSRFMGAVTGIFRRSSDNEVADVEPVVAEETDTEEIADAEDQTAAYIITPPVVEVVEEPGRVRRMMGSVTGFFSASDDDAVASSGETGSSFDFAIPSSTRNTVTLTSMSLSLSDFVALVAQNNDRINYQRMEWEISRAGVNSAKSMYEPAVIATYRYTDSNTPNTTEEEFRRAFSPEFIEQNNDYSLGVEGMVPTGGKVKVSFTNRDLDNNIQPSPISGEESRSYVGLSFTQPLLKGAGGRSVVEAPITVAEKEQEIARQTYRLSLFESISNAALAYWDLYLADETLALRLRSVAIVESVLEDERERNRLGRSSNIDVLTAESAVAQRRVQMYAARQSMVQAKNRLKGFVVGLDNQENLKIDGDANLSLLVENPDRQATLVAAFNHRPEYLASLVRAQKEDVRIQFASNSRLPQLDLVASYGLNGLDRNLSSSWDDLNTREHETMYVGLEFKMMLLGDRKAKSELSAATYRKHQALLEVQAAEMSLHNSIDTALSNLLTAKLQVAELVSVSSTNERLLQVELARFEAGQSNSRDLLDLEERINQTLEIALQSKANLQKALVGVSLADGTLLQQFSLE
ncbi:MAG: outer membrane protein TolC [Candidatus Azotimanducaceae bacterium]|jgi:outer membrane protein TolC